MAGVAAIPGIPMSVAYCKQCIRYAHGPAWAFRANVALCGGPDGVDPAYLDNMMTFADGQYITMREELTRRPLTPEEMGLNEKGEDVENFQQDVDVWVVACLGQDIANDKVERYHRFLEEALELVQVTGCTRSEAHQLVDYVFNRPAGELVDEVGGTMTTLAALCSAHGVSMAEAGAAVLTRNWERIDAIREKQRNKPKHGPLPIAVPAAPEVLSLTDAGSGLYAVAKGMMLAGRFFDTAYRWVAVGNIVMVFANETPVYWVERTNWEAIRTGRVTCMAGFDGHKRDISSIIRAMEEHPDVESVLARLRDGFNAGR